jgi:hypothetical protein
MSSPPGCFPNILKLTATLIYLYTGSQHTKYAKSRWNKNRFEQTTAWSVLTSWFNSNQACPPTCSTNNHPDFTRSREVHLSFAIRVNTKVSYVRGAPLIDTMTDQTHRLPEKSGRRHKNHHLLKSAQRQINVRNYTSGYHQPNSLNHSMTTSQ